MSRRILIVDDEQGIRAALGQLLEFEGYDVRTAANAVDGLSEYAKFKPHLVFMDVKMAGIDGLEALRKLREQDPGAIVVMISGHATIQTAVEATQHGAYDILEKPYDIEDMKRLLGAAMLRTHLDAVAAVHQASAALVASLSRDDFPERDDEQWLGHLYAERRRDGSVATSFHPVPRQDLA